jgi:hypothetical protein
MIGKHSSAGKSVAPLLAGTLAAGLLLPPAQATTRSSASRGTSPATHRLVPVPQLHAKTRSDPAID